MNTSKMEKKYGKCKKFKIRNFYSVTELINFNVRALDFILAEQGKDTKKKLEIKIYRTGY